MRERCPEKDCCTWLTQMMTSVCVVQSSVTTTVHIYVHHFQDLSHPDNQIEKNQMLFLGLLNRGFSNGIHNAVDGNLWKVYQNLAGYQRYAIIPSC